MPLMPPDVETKKPRLQQHQLSMLYLCPKQYEFRYIYGLKTPPGIALVTGSATHASIETNLRNKIATGQLLDEDQVTDAARDKANELWDEEGVVLSPDEKDEGESTVRGRVIDQAVALSRLHHLDLAPKLEPISVERTFLLELEGYPVDLAGTMDIEEAVSVRDTKTYGKSPSQKSVDANVQMTLYSFAKETREGVRPKSLFMDVLLKKKTPELKVYETRRNDLDYDTLFARVDVAVKTIQSGIFSPCAPDNWICSQEWCGYYDSVCEYGRRGRSQHFVPSTEIKIIKKDVKDEPVKRKPRARKSVANRS